MSPDEDERMERAERIRELREAGGGAGSARGRNGDVADAGRVTGGAADADGGTADEAGGAGAGGDGGADGGDDASTAPAGGATGVELPDREQMEAALAGAAGTTDAAGEADVAKTRDAAGAADPAVEGDADGDDVGAVDVGLPAPEEPAPGGGVSGRGATTAAARARVLEFTLGDELYCIDIAGVEEIVARETVTRVPNTPEYVEGVVDLRGQITTILDAKRMLDIEAPGPESLLVVFAADAFDEQGALGWIVDEVRQVRPVTEDEIREDPSGEDHVEGIVDRADADELVVWVRPEDVIGATADDADGA